MVWFLFALFFYVDVANGIHPKTTKRKHEAEDRRLTRKTEKKTSEASQVEQ